MTTSAPAEARLTPLEHLHGHFYFADLHTGDIEGATAFYGELIGWQSTENADVATAGSVRFVPAPDGGTEIIVHLQYEPPAGKLGSLVASMFGEEPSQQIRADLRRLKEILETGDVPRVETMYS